MKSSKRPYPDHCYFDQRPGARRTCGRRLPGGQMVYLVEGGLQPEGVARALYDYALSNYGPDIELELMLHPLASVHYDALLPPKPHGQRQVTGEAMTLFFSALHPDRLRRQEKPVYNASIVV